MRKDYILTISHSITELYCNATYSNYFLGGLPESFCCLSPSAYFFRPFWKLFPSLWFSSNCTHTHHNHKKAIDKKMFSRWMAVVAAHSCQKMILIALRLSFEVAHHTLSIYYIHHQYPFYKCLHKNWKGLLWKRRPLLSCNVYYRRWLFPPYVGSAAVHFSESIFAAWPKNPCSVCSPGHIILGVWTQT